MWGLTFSGKERNYRVQMTEVHEEGEAGVEEGVAALAATMVLQTLVDVRVVFGVGENDKLLCVYIYKRKDMVEKAKKTVVGPQAQSFIKMEKIIRKEISSTNCGIIAGQPNFIKEQFFFQKAAKAESLMRVNKYSLVLQKETEYIMRVCLVWS